MSVVDEMEAMELGAGMRKIRKRETWSKYLHIGIFQKMGTWCGMLRQSKLYNCKFQNLLLLNGTYQIVYPLNIILILWLLLLIE